MNASIKFMFQTKKVKKRLGGGEKKPGKDRPLKVIITRATLSFRAHFLPSALIFETH